MNFCSHCGSGEIRLKIPKGDTFLRYVCSSCKTVHYQNPNIITGAIAVWDGKIMLARRGIAPRKGLWNLPCGFLELNETIEEGAIREVKEETGVEIALQHLHTVYSIAHANQVYVIFMADMLHENFMITPESTEIQLFDTTNLPWDELAFSSNTFALKNYIEDLNTGFTKVHVGAHRKSIQ